MVSSESYEWEVKVVLVGSGGVGKSSLLSRVAENEFNPKYSPTMGSDCNIRTFDFEGKKCMLQIWDLAGQEQFKTRNHLFYLIQENKNHFDGVQGIIVVYDITNRQSYKEIDQILNQFEANVPYKLKKIIVGNKSDLEEQR
jgi:small GTP-binding protein